MLAAMTEPKREPAVSVVMGVYNGAASVGETIESILAQTETDFEFVIVDDGSNDETASILRSYADRDPRICVIRQQNAGLTHALIAGCEAARGTLIARQDCGDLSLPHRLHRQKVLFDADPDLAFVSCWTQFVGPNLEPMFESKGAGGANDATFILDFNQPRAVIDGPTCHPSVMFRRDAYTRAGRYRAAFYFGQDWDLWYRLAAVGKFQMVPECLYLARVTPGSISADAHDAQHQLGELSLAAAFARGRGESEGALLLNAALIRPVAPRSGFRGSKGLYFIGESLRRNRDPRSRAYLRQAIRANPFSPRNWVRFAQSLLLPARRP